MFVRNEVAMRRHAPRFRRRALHFVRTCAYLLRRDMHRQLRGDELGRRKHRTPRRNLTFARDALNACRLGTECERTESVIDGTSAPGRVANQRLNALHLYAVFARGSWLFQPSYTSGLVSPHDAPRRLASGRKPNAVGCRLCCITAHRA